MTDHNDIAAAMQVIKGLPDKERHSLEQQILGTAKKMLFIPNAGPQTQALLNPAEIMLYGGSAGSGKSYLLIGAALTQHRRSLIMRRKYTDMTALADEMIKMYGTRDGYTSMPKPKLRTYDGRLVEFGACQNVGDEEGFQGAAHDNKSFDELTQFTESQFRYIITWNRTDIEDQRCRVIGATNPPTSSDGDWVIGYWRPWLDPTFDKPAAYGEIRWVITDPDGKDMWVDGPTPVDIGGRTVIPKSRTFVPGKLSDNPYLVKTNYASTLDSLPEPMRSAMRDGNFMLSREDGYNQCIPTKWVKEAMARWHTNIPAGVPQCAIGADVSAGGKDETILAIRYDGWFDKLVSVPGAKIKDGSEIAALVLTHRRDNAEIIMDMGGGYGGAPSLQLKSNDVKVTPFKGSEATPRKTSDKSMGFSNSRTAAYWQFREALDPAQPGGSPICLPDDPKLLQDLTAPTFDLCSKGFKLETKEEIRSRLGRSTDRADAVVLSWWSGLKGIAPKHPAHGKSAVSRAQPKVIMGYDKRRR